jgi:rhamnosyltransferase
MDQETGFSVALIVPTLNAGALWKEWLNAFAQQTLKPQWSLVIDSSSDDDTATLAREFGFDVRIIQRSEFNHGGTRQWGADQVLDAEVIVYLTQDALLASPLSLARLVGQLRDSKLGAAYGRQLPHRGANPIETHDRLFNYPIAAVVKSINDADRLGIKTAFISNSFAAYRRRALTDAGGFRNHLILGEDTVVAARMLLKGWKIAYVADAQVYHSHAYSVLEELRRFFDTGVLHARENWLTETFGKPEGEGTRYVFSQLNYLWQWAPWLMPSAVVRIVFKLMGYRLGLLEARIPTALKKRLSMHRRYWERSTPA